MVELFNQKQPAEDGGVPIFTPTCLRKFSFDQSAHSSVLLQQGKQTKV